jgi:lipoprotein-releasing system ATP-binding protein
LYELAGVGKEVAGPTENLVILRSVDLTVEEGDSLAVLGASGSGKSTLLHILGTLDHSSWGMVRCLGRDMAGLTERERVRLRNREIGFVFQFHHLLPEFSTLENVAMPGLIAGKGRAESLALAAEALERVEMAGRAAHRVTTLSGGERQRAAIARAILLRPRVLLADEPTGNLDEKTGARVAELLSELNETLHMTLVVVTHNLSLASRMRRRLELRSGELYEHDETNR